MRVGRVVGGVRGGVAEEGDGGEGAAGEGGVQDERHGARAVAVGEVGGEEDEGEGDEVSLGSC